MLIGHNIKLIYINICESVNYKTDFKYQPIIFNIFFYYYICLILQMTKFNDLSEN